MPLPAPVARKSFHTRRVVYGGFERDDGLWDIEAQLVDVKDQICDLGEEGVWNPGDVMHDLSIRVTIDTHLVVQDICTSMDSVPHRECPTAQDTMRRMIGASMARGWRKAIETRLGGIEGCSHLRELLFNMATVAFQTLPEEAAPPRPDGQPPFFIGKCMAWDVQGPAVKRMFPIYYQPPEKVPSAE